MTGAIVQRREAKRLVEQLDQTVYDIKTKLSMASLRGPAQGCKPGMEWREPAALASTIGTLPGIRIAATTVIGVLGEIKKLKPAGTALMIEARADAKPAETPAPRSYRDHLPDPEF